MAAMNKGSTGGFSGGKLSFKKIYVRRGLPLYFARKPPSLGPDDQS
jgi:hypothetical protein